MKVLQVNDPELYAQCVQHIEFLAKNGYNFNMSEDEMVNVLYTMELEKREKNEKSDKKLDYNDEIVDIKPVGEKETIDISVTGDNLFFCNDILTKNSFGLPATSDLFFAIITSEKLDATGQVMIKQLKNRYNDLSSMRRFCLGIDRPKMRLYDLDNPLAALGQSADSFGSNDSDNSNKSKNDFSNFQF